MAAPQYADQLQPFWTNLGILTAIMFGRYFAFAGGAYLFLYKWGQKRFAWRKIDPKPPGSKIMKTEILHSLSSSLLFGLSGAVGLEMWRAGWTFVYFDPAEYGWFYFFASLPILLFVHDTYFYFTHRAMHHPKLFALFHRVHHESFNPTPWAAFSFSFGEAFVLAAFLPLAMLVIPVHPVMLLIFLGVMTVMGVVNHTGYEFFPAGFYRNPIGKWIIGAADHFVHHRKVQYNFALYFTFWDHWLGTADPNFHAFYDKLKERAKDVPVSSGAVQAPHASTSPERAVGL